MKLKDDKKKELRHYVLRYEKSDTIFYEISLKSPRTSVTSVDKI